MTAIWHKEGNEWAILSPSGFPDEAALHSLVEEAPHVLPLSGAPRLVVLGRERGGKHGWSRGWRPPASERSIWRASQARRRSGDKCYARISGQQRQSR